MQEQLMDVYERLEDMAADTAEARAAHILHGLGFTAKMQKTPTKDFSGGWRMRIALARYAKILSIHKKFRKNTIESSTCHGIKHFFLHFFYRALYVKPHLLLLDEPTNHLDLDACVWLEEELKTYKRILVIISHSQDFLNGICTNIIHVNKKQLKYYTGNYEAFVKTR